MISMEHIIQHIAVELVERITKEAISGKISDIDGFASSTLEECKTAARKIVEAVVEQMNLEIREAKGQRKQQGLLMKEKDRQRHLLTELGTLSLNRDYYFDRKQSVYTVPLDLMLGISKYERVGGCVSAKLVSEATESSYAKSTLRVTGGMISRQTVRNRILQMPVHEKEIEEEKQRVTELHIFADEDHVHMQKPGKIKGKKNQIVPLVTVSEGIEASSQGRNRVKAPMHFTDEKFDTKSVWESVERYIYKAYDIEELEKIYVHADGGKWIKNGLENFDQAEYVMDGYHFEKALKSVTRGFKGGNYRGHIHQAVEAGNQEAVRKLLDEMLERSADQKQEKKVKEFATYVMGNFESIVNRVSGTTTGSCTEAQISHVLSKRFSRDPLGWSKEGLGKLAKARVYVLNGGKITSESFKEKQESQNTYREYANTILQENIEKHFNWSLFENELQIFDTMSGTQNLIKMAGSYRSMLI